MNADKQSHGNDDLAFCFAPEKAGATNCSDYWPRGNITQLDPRPNEAANVDAVKTVMPGPAISGHVLDNDKVAEPVRAIELVAGPARGKLVFKADGAFTYYPAAGLDALAEGETATETFTYCVTDVDWDRSTAAASITITGTQDGPIPSSIVFTPALAFERFDHTHQWRKSRPVVG
ncbi:MAG: hypothetical protein GKS00_05275 [Alphaproteobacteria bacterium]|nr:hypothetical protein [Alphaproteobacteria bacterium]